MPKKDIITIQQLESALESAKEYIDALAAESSSCEVCEAELYAARQTIDEQTTTIEQQTNRISDLETAVINESGLHQSGGRIISLYPTPVGETITDLTMQFKFNTLPKRELYWFGETTNPRIQGMWEFGNSNSGFDISLNSTKVQFRDAGIQAGIWYILRISSPTSTTYLIELLQDSTVIKSQTVTMSQKPTFDNNHFLLGGVNNENTMKLVVWNQDLVYRHISLNDKVYLASGDGRLVDLTSNLTKSMSKVITGVMLLHDK